MERSLVLAQSQLCLRYDEGLRGTFKVIILILEHKYITAKEGVYDMDLPNT